MYTQQTYIMNQQPPLSEMMISQFDSSVLPVGEQYTSFNPTSLSAPDTYNQDIHPFDSNNIYSETTNNLFDNPFGYDEISESLDASTLPDLPFSPQSEDSFTSPQVHGGLFNQSLPESPFMFDENDDIATSSVTTTQRSSTGELKTLPPKKKIVVACDSKSLKNATPQAPLLIHLPADLVWCHQPRTGEKQSANPSSPSSSTSVSGKKSRRNSSEKVTKRRKLSNGNVEQVESEPVSINDSQHNNSISNNENKDEVSSPNCTSKSKRTTQRRVSVPTNIEIKAQLLYVDSDYQVTARGQRLRTGIDINQRATDPNAFIEFTHVPEDRKTELMSPALFCNYSVAVQAVTRDFRFPLKQAFLLYQTNPETGKRECLGHLCHLLQDTARVRFVNNLSLVQRNNMVDRIYSFAAGKLIQSTQQMLDNQYDSQELNNGETKSEIENDMKNQQYSKYETSLWSAKRVSYARYLLNNGLYSPMRLVQFESDVNSQ